MGWLALLNPANWIKVLSMISSAISLIRQAYEAYQNSERKKADEKRAEESAAKLEKAIKEGDDDKIAEAGLDVLNGR